LQNPAVLAHFGRRPTASQLGAIASQLNSALDAFANTRDATTAAAALSNFSRGLDMLARLVAGT
jgi:pyridoxine/pyridoxamine 5'-phosphate oxidase